MFNSIKTVAIAAAMLTSTSFTAIAADLTIEVAAAKGLITVYDDRDPYWNKGWLKAKYPKLGVADMRLDCTNEEVRKDLWKFCEDEDTLNPSGKRRIVWVLHVPPEGFEWAGMSYGAVLQPSYLPK